MFANRSVVLGAIFACLTLGASAFAVPAEQDRLALRARAWVGPVNVEMACQLQQGEAWHAKTVSKACNGWVCEDNHGKQTGVNMNQACVAEYFLPQTYGVCEGGVYHWSCYYDL